MVAKWSKGLVCVTNIYWSWVLSSDAVGLNLIHALSENIWQWVSGFTRLLRLPPPLKFIFFYISEIILKGCKTSWEIYWVMHNKSDGQLSCGYRKCYRLNEDVLEVFRLYIQVSYSLDRPECVCHCSAQSVCIFIW